MLTRPSASEVERPQVPSFTGTSGVALLTALPPPGRLGHPSLRAALRAAVPTFGLGPPISAMGGRL
eukprot:4296711-Pyramimonas_sp.AAC.1